MLHFYIYSESKPPKKQEDEICENINHGIFPFGESSPQEISFENRGSGSKNCDNRAFSGWQNFWYSIHS